MVVHVLESINGSLDVGVLSALMAEIGPTESGLRDELLYTFLHEGAIQVIAIELAARAGDRPAVKAVAHPLKSSSAWLGALRLSACCLALEDAADDLSEDLVAPAGRLVAEFASAAAAIRALPAAS